MDDRMAEAEELVARVIGEHIDMIQPGFIVCTCGWKIAGDVGAQAAVTAYTRHRADAVLAALADAGLLLPPGGQVQETREEWGTADVPDHPEEVWPIDEQRAQSLAARAEHARLFRRTITLHTGPWREVSDGD